MMRLRWKENGWENTVLEGVEPDLAPELAQSEEGAKGCDRYRELLKSRKKVPLWV